ncbi:ribosomal protein L17 [Cavenderia fasciculata]|uniref:Ribosomal protein L17 n=1 Tax=Cavenderia fasciculata TaxID=261658 RepID=F4Q3B3_CACFS|nr:ribosomal protein L17 [Cavenderia fasciculata]EGG17623.1 ribosomal protein L17 [Cavenderia fasciculata]|eukprot:XP_004356107.1 ribosomal protein L17 [Cavenderia fasciculata]
MYHQMGYAKLSKPSTHRMLMLRTMVTQLIQHERLKTTLPKARALSRFADKIITLSKRNTTMSHKLAYSIVTDRRVLPKLFKQLRLRFGERDGGYTRVLKCGVRESDKAPMAYIEYVENDLTPLRDNKANNARYHVVRQPVEQGIQFSYVHKETGAVLSSALSLTNRLKKLELNKKEQEMEEQRKIVSDIKKSFNKQ